MPAQERALSLTHTESWQLPSQQSACEQSWPVAAQCGASLAMHIEL
jgi:hypothetical protein